MYTLYFTPAIFRPNAFYNLSVLLKAIMKICPSGVEITKFVNTIERTLIWIAFPIQVMQIAYTIHRQRKNCAKKSWQTQENEWRSYPTTTSIKWRCFQPSYRGISLIYASAWRHNYTFATTKHEEREKKPLTCMSRETWGDRANGLWIAGKIGVRNSRFVTVYVVALRSMTHRLIWRSREWKRFWDCTRSKLRDATRTHVLREWDIISEINRFEVAAVTATWQWCKITSFEINACGNKNNRFMSL